MDQSIGFHGPLLSDAKTKDASAKTSRRKNKFLVSHENAGKYSRCRWQNGKCFAAYEPIKIRAIFGTDMPTFIATGSKIATDQQIAALQGKMIGITGTIELYQGKPEIEVTSIAQIKGADSQPGTRD